MRIFLERSSVRSFSAVGKESYCFVERSFSTVEMDF